MGDQGDYWYKPSTGEVEHGRISPWTDRMGPYPTAEAARHALETARARSQDWDEEDRRWREE